MNKMYEIQAFDDGYADSKSKCISSPAFVTPSYVTQWRPQYDISLSNIRQSPLSRIEIEVDEQRYLVGEAALQQDKRLQWNGSEDKHSDSNFDRLLKTHLGLMSQTSKSDIVRLVMGLPVKTSLDVRRIGALKNKTIGQHSFGIKLINEASYKKKTIFVEDVIVKAQTHGTLANMVLNDLGKLSDRETAKKVIAISDIGGRTHNVYVVDALDPLSDFCDTTNSGLYFAYMRIRDHIFSSYGWRINECQIQKIIPQGRLKGHDVSAIIQQSLEQLSRDIILELKTKWDAIIPYIDEIYFTGGGSILLKPYLVKEFPRAKFLTQTSNVEGFLKLGIRNWIVKGA